MNELETLMKEIDELRRLVNSSINTALDFNTEYSSQEEITRLDKIRLSFSDVDTKIVLKVDPEAAQQLEPRDKAALFIEGMKQESSDLEVDIYKLAKNISKVIEEKLGETSIYFNDASAYLQAEYGVPEDMREFLIRDYQARKIKEANEKANEAKIPRDIAMKQHQEYLKKSQASENQFKAYVDASAGVPFTYQTVERRIQNIDFIPLNIFEIKNTATLQKELPKYDFQPSPAMPFEPLASMSERTIIRSVLGLSDPLLPAIDKKIFQKFRIYDIAPKEE